MLLWAQERFPLAKLKECSRKRDQLLFNSYSQHRERNDAIIKLQKVPMAQEDTPRTLLAAPWVPPFDLTLGLVSTSGVTADVSKDRGNINTS